MTKHGLNLVDIIRRADGSVAIGSARNAQPQPMPAGASTRSRTRGGKRE
jgi:hypothetical protein